MLNKINIKKNVYSLGLLSCFLFTSSFSKVKIAFWINFLAMRGTQVATYDYADFNETILGNESIILNNQEFFDNPNPWLMVDYNETVRNKFINRFPGRFFDCANMKEAEEILKREKVDIFYALKGGKVDNNISKVCKNAFHAVFEIERHGDAYACISDWLIEKFNAPQIPFVPHMIRLDSTKENLRAELGIPESAVVFGRHGGLDCFSIPFAKEAVVEMAQQHPEWYFLFLNTARFCNLKNVIFLPGTADMVFKTKFINTCDAMIHARIDGETFGLCCGEFSIQNKPVLTCYYGDLAHIRILGDKGFYYRNKQELMSQMNYIATHLDVIRSSCWDCYSKEYCPEVVMRKFDEVFIQPLISHKG